ncbi:hypothetical protein TRVL_04025 [Trypanosoma vivax]|nr:hypothetical protein TRVL_04025 [Trypanosoma vivax]
MPNVIPLHASAPPSAVPARSIHRLVRVHSSLRPRMCHFLCRSLGRVPKDAPGPNMAQLCATRASAKRFVVISFVPRFRRQARAPCAFRTAPPESALVPHPGVVLATPLVARVSPLGCLRSHRQVTTLSRIC